LTVDLVKRASDGDVGAFDTLVGPRIERMVRTAMAILGSEVAAPQRRGTAPLDRASDSPMPMIEAPGSQQRRVGVPRSRRGRLTALIAVAVAGLALLLVGTGTIGGPPTASPGPLPLLDAAQLRAEIAAQRAGGLAPQDVVANVAIDGSRQTPPLERECVPIGQCDVIGTLAGFDDPAGTVTIRQQDQEPPPTNAGDLAAPVALRLSGSGPLEFLGHVRLTSDGLAWSVPDALAATSNAAAR
jgi:hypothetical protein